ncbi:MAG: DUF935 domain-containing protein [Pseudolabrys sp.]
MADKPILYGPDNQPISRAALTTEVAAPSLTGVRSPLTGYPGDGLDPRRLAALLREADQGEPLRYLELAEQIEERDLHYAGVLSTRKRSVAQLDITVEAGSDKPEYVAHADMVRTWLKRDELQDELFDILDAIGKGFSITEIIWDSSAGQWQPARLEWRDPRWFRFLQHDGRTPLLRTETGDQPLLPFKFVTAVMRAKSGLPVRSGIARLATWSWMFKAFTMRDWAIFTQTFGQPVRVGKYPSGATKEDQDTLFRAVANIAGDCAGIIPATMDIEFIESKNVGQGAGLYEARCNWLDQQVSKAVLGQTATTDAIAGGHAVGQEHREVQEDIERADARALSAILNRDLVRAWIDLEYGPQQFYPRLRIGRTKERDLTQTIDGIQKMVPLGLRVEESVVRDMLGIEEPAKDAVLLKAPTPSLDPTFGGYLPRPNDPAAQPTLHAQRRRDADAVEQLARQAEHLASSANDAMIDQVRAVVDQATDLSDLKKRIGELTLAPDKLAAALRLALAMANLSGRAEIVDAV